MFVIRIAIAHIFYWYGTHNLEHEPYLWNMSTFDGSSIVVQYSVAGYRFVGYCGHKLEFIDKTDLGSRKIQQLHGYIAVGEEILQQHLLSSKTRFIARTNRFILFRCCLRRKDFFYALRSILFKGVMTLVTHSSFMPIGVH